MKEHDHLMPRHQRDYPRIFSFIKAHALLNCFNREKLSEDTILANQTDIDAGFALYKGIEQSNEMGLSPYILKIYDDAFMPILKVNEGVSREDILKQYYKTRHKPMSPEILRLEIIPQLEAVGLIYQEEGERRKMLVYPTVSHTYNQSIVLSNQVCSMALGKMSVKSEDNSNRSQLPDSETNRGEHSGLNPLLEEETDFKSMPLLRCPHCDFRNVYQESIDHHVKYKHQQGGA
jgi:hypothetical protein